MKAGDGEEGAERGEISTRAGLTNDASLHMPHLPSRFAWKLQTCLYTMRVRQKKKTLKTFCTLFATTFPLQRGRSFRERHNSSRLSYPPLVRVFISLSFPLFMFSLEGSIVHPLPLYIYIIYIYIMSFSL